MTARVLACLVVGAFASFGTADDADAKKAAKAQAQEGQTALVKGDYDKLVDATHPKIVDGMGGRKKMVEKLSTEMKEMKSKGFTFKSVSLGDPSDPVKAGTDLYIIVPFTLEITVPGGTGRSPGSLMGVSSDGGKTWVFADTAPGRDTLKKVFSDLPDALVFPKKERPTFVKD